MERWRRPCWRSSEREASQQPNYSRSEPPKGCIRNRTARPVQEVTDSFPAYHGPRAHVRTHARMHALMHCCGAARPRPRPRCDRVVRACEIMHSGAEGSKLRPIQKTHLFCKTLCFLRDSIPCVHPRHRTTVLLQKRRGLHVYTEGMHAPRAVTA
jgi:hypothetical protein